ncbi:hypothetical protein D3C87_279940 [compost metagenome]
MDSLRENVFLRELAVLSNSKLEFKDENILPGTVWINEMPLDISIKENRLVLNAVGEFGGSARTFAKSKNKGRGLFRLLYPNICDLINRHNLESKIYLTPLSPVWEKHYELKETSEPFQGHWFYLDITPELLLGREL